MAVITLGLSVWAQRVFGLILSVLVTLIWGVSKEGGVPWLVRER